MTSDRAPCLLGLLASLGAVGGIFLPYALVDELAAATYYEFAPLRMEAVGLAAAVAIVLLLGSLLGRISEPAIAGSLLVLGSGMLLNTVAWASSVPLSLVMGLPVPDEFAYHRFALVLVTALVAASGLWYVERSLPA